MQESINPPSNILEQGLFFPSPVYWIDKSEVLESLKEAADFHLNHTKNFENFEKNQTYPVVMTGPLHNDGRFAELINYVAETSWNILESQGHDMTNLHTYVHEAWVQKHNTHSGHDEHVHSMGSQISAFYIIEAPENSSALYVCDPRPGKRQININEPATKEINMASQRIYFNMKPGTIYFMNSWLPHGLSRNASSNPVKFIHFNVSVFFNNSTIIGSENLSTEIV